MASHFENGSMVALLFLFGSLVFTADGQASVPHPINLCCPPHYFYNIPNHTCIRSHTNLFPTLFNEENIALGKVEIANATGMVTCKESYYTEEPQINLINNGFLRIYSGENEDMTTALIRPDEFCLLWPSKQEITMGALICFPENYVKIMDTYVIPTLMGISAVFLAATFIIYLYGKGSHDLLSKSFLCSISMLFLTKATGVLIKGTSLSQSSYGVCITLGMIFHITFLSAFFWLNVISFVVFALIWFRAKFQAQKSVVKALCLLISCIYAFGSPLIILMFILLRDMTDVFDETGIPKPQLGHTSCGFSNRESQLVFFYAPIAVLLGINLILFLLSAFKLCSNRSHTSRFQFYNYLKLLLLMGIPWIFEVLSFFFMDRGVFSAATVFWYIMDVLNASQGVFIFFVFAFQRKFLSRTMAKCCGESYAKRKYPGEFEDADENQTQSLTQDFKMTEKEEAQSQE